MIDNHTIYKFRIPGDPVGKQRGRTFIPPGGKYPVTTTPPKTRNFESLVKMCAVQAGVKPLEYVSVVIVVSIPVRITPRKTMPPIIHEPRQRPDLDNVVKSVCDALNGIAYRDDKNILDLKARYSFIAENEQAYTEVRIEESAWEHHRE